jgi:ATP-dependent Clp endopeptidase proteolytic subunit ClpP
MSELGSLDINELIEQLQSTADPVLYQYFKNLNKRTIIINEQISESIIECAVLPLLEWDNDGTGEEINILLNTVGGSTMNGLLLCDVIDKLKTKTTITVLAYAYSMGSLIIMAGFNNPNVTVKCYQFSTGLIHGGSDFLQGTTSQIKDYYNFNTKYEEKIKEFILTHSKISEEEYEKMSRYEWYLVSEDMEKYGLVDEII